MELNVEGTKQLREAIFWDNVAERTTDDTATLKVAPDDLYDRTMPWLGSLDMEKFVTDVFDHCGIEPGMRVLDLGCGKGFLAIALAHRGARVDAIDISPKSIELCRKRAINSGVGDAVTFHVMDCEQLDFPDETFDAVCGSFVLHHLDLKKIAREIERVTKPGCKSAFIETVGLNPLLMAARATLPGRFGIEKASTDDEYPLNRERLAILSGNFRGHVTTRFPRVVFFRMGEYLPFLRNSLARIAMAASDHLIWSMPPLRLLSYYGIVTLDRQG